MVTTGVRKRTVRFIAEQKTATSPEGDRTAASFAFQPKRKPRGRPFPKGNKVGHRWKKGESGNPGGLPGTNVSQRIARAVLAKYEPQIIEGLGVKLRRGDGYVFSVVADRADGKVAQSVDMNVNGRLTLKQALEAEERAEKVMANG